MSTAHNHSIPVINKYSPAVQPCPWPSIENAFSAVHPAGYSPEIKEMMFVCTGSLPFFSGKGLGPSSTHKVWLGILVGITLIGCNSGDWGGSSQCLGLSSTHKVWLGIVMRTAIQVIVGGVPSGSAPQ